MSGRARKKNARASKSGQGNEEEEAGNRKNELESGTEEIKEGKITGESKLIDKEEVAKSNTQRERKI